MNVFEAVKQSVTTRQAAEHYGIHVGRNGMACCPFHHDKTPSMKLDRRYHCFGCGADGDVIDFTAALYGLGKKEAAVQLAQDFGLSYEDWKSPGKAKKPKPRQKSPEEQFQEAKSRCFRILADYLHPAPGLFIYQLCKFISSLGGGIILRLILSICQDELRNCLLCRTVLTAACAGCGQNHDSGAGHQVNHIFSQAAVPPFGYIIPQLPDPVKAGLSFNYAQSCLPPLRRHNGKILLSHFQAHGL